MNNIENAYTDLNNLISINADEIRTNNLYVDGILILPSSTNFNNINCQTLTCQTDLSSNTLYATVSIQGVPVAKFAFLDATSSIQGQFNNIITNYVSNSSLTSTLANYVSLTGTQSILGVKTFTAITKMTNDLYFSDTGKSIYFTPNNLPPTTNNTTYLRITALSNNSYIDYGNGSLYIRTANAATGLPTGQQFEFSSAGWLICYAISCASIFNFSYIDFRSISNPSTNFLINNNTIPLLAIIGLQTALDAKLSTTTAASTYLTQSSAASTYATIASLANYLTTASAASTYLTITNAAATYATIASLANYLTTTSAASTYLTITDASSTYLTQSSAASTYATIASLANYLTTASAASTYLTITNAASTYLSQSSAASTYLTQTNASSTYLSKVDASNNYVGVSNAQTISGQKSFTSFIKNTSAYYFSADGATTSSIYCTPNANPAQAGNNAYMRQFAASSTGNCYYDYANSIIFRNANATNGNTTGYEISFSPTGSIVCGALYTAIISSFSYIDFRSITTPSTNMLFNNNMINKSVIIGLTGDLSTITTNISNLDTRVTADEVVIAANTTAIAGLVTTTTTHTTQIAALTTSVGVLQGQMTTAESNITALQAKTAYQSVVSTSTQFTNNLKMMNGLNYTILLNGTTGQADFYGLMTIYNNLNVNGVAGGSGGTISSTNITGSAITANTTLSSGGTLSVTGASTLNGTTLTTGNLVISSGSLTISSALGTNTFNNSCSFTNGLISTNLVSNSLNYKDAVVNIGNTSNIYTTGGSALSFNTLNIGNLTTNVNINGIVTLTGLTYFNGPSFNMSSYINQL